MTLTKKKMVREIGRRTRLTNREVQEVVETLVDLWTEALVEGQKIEIENFFILETITIDRGNKGILKKSIVPIQFNRITCRASKKLKNLINRASPYDQS